MQRAWRARLGGVSGTPCRPPVRPACGDEFECGDPEMARHGVAHVSADAKTQEVSKWAGVDAQ